MVYKITNLIEFNSFIGTEPNIQVIILHSPNSGFLMMMNGLIERLEDEYDSQLIRFYCVDILNPAIESTMEMYNIKEIPAILFFQNGFLQNKLEGVITKLEFETILNRVYNDTNT